MSDDLRSVAPMKVFPPGVSVVIPQGGPERLPLLTACLSNLRPCPDVSEIVVVEMGSIPFAQETARQWADKYLFVRNDGVFERARCLNIGSAIAQYDLVLWLDNDLIVPPEFIAKAAAEMRAAELDYLTPYTLIEDLSAPDTEQVLQGVKRPSDCAPVRSVRAGQVHGGAGVVRKSFFARYGGLWEEFRGWGGEDDAWWTKARRLGRAQNTQRHDQLLFQLFHPRSRATGNPYYSNNCALLEEILSLRDPQLLLQRFPPSTTTFRLWTERRTAFLTEATGEADEFARQIARVLREAYGFDIDWQVALHGNVASEQLLRAQPPDAMVVFGNGVASRVLSSESWRRLWPRTVVVCAGGMSEDAVRLLERAGAVCCADAASARPLEQAGLRPWTPGARQPSSGALSAALALLQPLSIILGDATSR